MLPRKLRNRMFDRMSTVTMRRFFHPIPTGAAEGLVKRVYDSSRDEFFINGTITGHSAHPEIMAGIWVGGREVALVDDAIEAWVKKAMGAAVSRANECPYCQDFLVSLTHGAAEHDVAAALRSDGVLGDRLADRQIAWAEAAARGEFTEGADTPFTEEQLPEAIGTLVVFGYTNRISDFTMEGSPVPTGARALALRMFGVELQESCETALPAGTALGMLTPAEAPAELWWAVGNPRVQDALARWYGVIDREIDAVMPRTARQAVEQALASWDGTPPPLASDWVGEALAPLSTEKERDFARLAITLAKAAYRVDDDLIARVEEHGLDEAGLIRLGAWGAMRGARAIANLAARHAEAAFPGADAPAAASLAS